MGFGGYLKQSTAVDILLGPFVDDADGDTALTTLTIDVELSKNGQALADSESAAPTHDAAGTVDGYYNCVLGTTDTNTLGILTVVAHHADGLPIRLDYQVVTANWWDSMCSTDQLDVNVTNVAGTGQTANDNGADINAILTDTGTTLDALIKDIPTVAEFEARTIVSADYTIVADLGTVQSGDSFAIVDGAHGLVSIQDDVDAILADTNELQTDWADGGRLDLIQDIIAADTTTDIPALIAALENISVANITGAEVDNDGTAISLAGALKLILAANTGKSSGGGTATIVFRDINDAKNRISATVDANGNRTAVGTRDAS